MTLGDVKIQTYQPAHWERGRETELKMMGGVWNVQHFSDYNSMQNVREDRKQRKWRMWWWWSGGIQTHSCARIATLHTEHLFAPFCVYLFKTTESCDTCWNQTPRGDSPVCACMCNCAVSYLRKSSSGRVEVGMPSAGQLSRWNCVKVLVSCVWTFFR